jgi:hypothetical protein
MAGIREDLACQMLVELYAFQVDRYLTCNDLGALKVLIRMKIAWG